MCRFALRRARPLFLTFAGVLLVLGVFDLITAAAVALWAVAVLPGAVA